MILSKAKAHKLILEQEKYKKIIIKSPCIRTDLQKHFKCKKYDRIQTFEKIDLFNKLVEGIFDKKKN